MSYKLLIDVQAKLDVRGTVTYYNEKTLGLGKEYFEAYKSALNIISDNPFIFRLRFKNTSKAPVGSRFPFFICFLIDEKQKTITIVSVLHGGRDPEVWKERVKGKS